MNEGGQIRIDRTDHGSPTADPLLNVRRVKERYALATPEAARRVMLETGHAFKLAGRLYVHLEALVALEQARRELPREPKANASQKRRYRARAALGVLSEDWWQDP